MCNAQGTTGTAAVIGLMAVYYLFDLDYPKVYSQLLGTLQNHIIKGVPYDGQQSSKFKMFNTALRRRMKTVE